MTPFFPSLLPGIMWSGRLEPNENKMQGLFRTAVLKAMPHITRHHPTDCSPQVVLHLFSNEVVFKFLIRSLPGTPTAMPRTKRVATKTPPHTFQLSLNCQKGSKKSSEKNRHFPNSFRKPFSPLTPIPVLISETTGAKIWITLKKSDLHWVPADRIKNWAQSSTSGARVTMSIRLLGATMMPGSSTVAFPLWKQAQHIAAKWHFQVRIFF